MFLYRFLIFPPFSQLHFFPLSPILFPLSRPLLLFIAVIDHVPLEPSFPYTSAISLNRRIVDRVAAAAGVLEEIGKIGMLVWWVDG